MTYIFTFHPLISCLAAIDYLGRAQKQVVLQTEEKSHDSQIRVSGLTDVEVAAVTRCLIGQLPGVPSEFRDGQMLRLEVEHGD